MPQFIKDNSFISVPTSFIRETLPSCNAAFVKVYLYLLLLAEEAVQTEYRDIAKTLGLLESDLLQAIDYLNSIGVLKANGETISFLGKTPSAFMEEPTTYNTNTENVVDAIASNKELSDMFMLCQEILGKTITEKDMQTIYWFYSNLKMPIEVILMLLEYCVSKGKNRISYIEKVAISWNEMGLNTTQSVNDYLESEEQRTGFLYSIRKIMGISDRSLSQIEEKYLATWHEDYKMTEEMIALAYEYCIIQTAKLSFPYMDKIISRWHTEGISTIQKAEEDNKKFKNRPKNKETAFSENDYNSTDLEILSRAFQEK